MHIWIGVGDGNGVVACRLLPPTIVMASVWEGMEIKKEALVARQHDADWKEIISEIEEADQEGIVDLYKKAREYPPLSESGRSNHKAIEAVNRKRKVRLSFPFNGEKWWINSELTAQFLAKKLGSTRTESLSNKVGGKGARFRVETPPFVKGTNLSLAELSRWLEEMTEGIIHSRSRFIICGVTEDEEKQYRLVPTHLFGIPLRP